MHLQLICMVYVRLRMRDTALKIQPRVEFADVWLPLSFRLSAATPPC